MEQEQEQNQNAFKEIWRWLSARGGEISRGFAKGYSWLYDLPYEEGMATSDAIALANQDVPPYSGTFGWDILASPASPIDPLYHLSHPAGYQAPQEARLMDQQDIEEVDFFRQVTRAAMNVEVGAPAALPGEVPTTIDTKYVEPTYEAYDAPDPTPYVVGTPRTYAQTPIAPFTPDPVLDPTLESYDPSGSWNYDPVDPITGDPGEIFGGGPTSMTLAPFGQEAPGALGVMGRRTLIKSWVAGPPGRRIRFFHFYMGNRKYTGCIKADGSWKQWPTYRPLVLGKTMTDRKAKRVARRMDSYMKSVRKIARVLGWTLKR